MLAIQEVIGCVCVAGSVENEDGGCGADLGEEVVGRLVLVGAGLGGGGWRRGQRGVGLLTPSLLGGQARVVHHRRAVWVDKGLA